MRKLWLAARRPRASSASLPWASASTMTIQVSLQQASPRRKRGGPTGLHACIWGLPHSRFQTSVPRTAYRMAWITGWSPCTRVHVGEEAAAATATAVALQRARGRAQQRCEGLAWHGVRCLERLVNQVAAVQCDRTCHCYRCDPSPVSVLRHDVFPAA